MLDKGRVCGGVRWSGWTGLGAGLCPDPLLFLPQLLEPCLTTGSSSPMGGPVPPSITQFLMLL